VNQISQTGTIASAWLYGTAGLILVPSADASSRSGRPLLPEDRRYLCTW
jgi:hypothetical protein